MAGLPCGYWGGTLFRRLGINPDETRSAGCAMAFSFCGYCSRYPHATLATLPGGHMPFVSRRAKLWPFLVPIAFLLLVAKVPMAVAGYDPVGAVYTMDNSALGNKVHIYRRFAGGLLAYSGAVPTDGFGTGESLGNQGAIQIDPSESYLYVVNAGSDSISVFEVTNEGLELLQTVSSQGHRPLSLSVSHDRLYVLNAGGSDGSYDSVAGFHVRSNGSLTAIAGSVARLSADVTRPAQIGLSPDGKALVITERETHKISVFDIADSGVPENFRAYNSEGLTPFGFEFGARGALVVAEGVLGNTNASSVSSYELNSDASLSVITSSAPTFQTAACWLALSPDKRMAFTTNPGSDSISRFALDFDGELTLQRRWSRLLREGDRPLDIVITRDSKTLYVLLSGSDEVAMIRILRSGRRARVAQRVSIPVGANGLAVR